MGAWGEALPPKSERRRINGVSYIHHNTIAYNMSTHRDTSEPATIVTANPAFAGAPRDSGAGTGLALVGATATASADTGLALTQARRRAMIRAGEKVYHTNDYLMYIYDIMTNNKFNEFFAKHIHSPSDVNTAMIYFNLFELVRRQYRETFGREVTRGEHIHLMQQCMRNRCLREAAIESARHLTGLRESVRGVIEDGARGEKSKPSCEAGTERFGV